MPDAIKSYSTSKYSNDQLGQIVDSMMVSAKDSRKTFERRWYDNNFFDDGHHFRYLNRTDNKIIDLTDSASLFNPMRAIPKASRQIRGMANLLVSQDYIPVIYPERVDKAQYPPQQAQDPQTGQMTMQPNPDYQKAIDQSKKKAKQVGHWIEDKIEEQNIKEEKVPHMVILTAKHGISYLKIWPDAIEEKLNTVVRDAFDVYVQGSMTNLEDLPFMGEGVPRYIAEIKADERFDPESLKQISPDNKHASSEIKDAYMRSRYGGEFNQSEQSSTLIQKEFYIKEYLNDDNLPRIKMQEDGDKILKRHTDEMGRPKYGDPILRQVFVAGNIPLRSQYVNLPDFPYVDYRLEPGPLYQVPLIERFIPQNKSLDMIVSRVERLTHVMVTGSWSVKKGEDQKPNNSAAGQIFTYLTTPPVQNQIASVPPFVFNFMELLNSYIVEQGTTMSTLGQVPSGVKAASAIESLKESEYANLVVATKQLKKTMKNIAMKMLDIADDYFVQPQTVYRMERGEPTYFDVIGGSALEERQNQGLMNGLSGEEVPLKRDYGVEIDIQSGLGYTKEGKKAAAKELGDWLVQMAQLQLINPEVVKQYTQALFEEYQFGRTEDVMEAMEDGNVTAQLTEEQLTMVKTAVLEALKEVGEIGEEASKKRIEETKIGTVEALNDTGVIDGKPQNPKDQVEIQKTVQQMKIDQETHDLKMQQMEQDMAIKEEEAEANLGIKNVQAAHAISIKEKQSQASIKNNEKMTKMMAKQPQKGTNGKKASVS